MDIPSLWVLVAALVFLILCSAFFAMAETALMSANKYKLRTLARRNHRGAITTLWLLDRTERLLALILIVNTLINTMATALATAIAIL
ncbi:MAG: CNNM domain-containing protein, partial [Gammaproteobacteria bacterium]